MCFDATSSFVAGGVAYGVSAYLLRRQDPQLRWGGLALAGITAMQWAEGFLWTAGPGSCGPVDRALTVVLIPLVLLTQVYGPLFGSLFAVPLRGRKLSFAAVFLAGFATVAWARFTYNPPCSAVTPQGYVNWWSAQNPPDYPPLVYALWALFIGASFLLWWRPLWQALTIVSFGWVWAWASYVLTDNAASNWCFFVSLYAVFVLIYAFMVPDRAQARVAPEETPTTTTRSQV